MCFIPYHSKISVPCKNSQIVACAIYCRQTGWHSQIYCTMIWIDWSWIRSACINHAVKGIRSSIIKVPPPILDKFIYVKDVHNRATRDATNNDFYAHKCRTKLASENIIVGGPKHRHSVFSDIRGISKIKGFKTTFMTLGAALVSNTSIILDRVPTMGGVKLIW